MTPDEARAYAEHLIEDHAQAIEWLSVFEMYPAYAQDDDAELSDEDARTVDGLISQATVTVSWPDSVATGGAR